MKRAPNCAQSQTVPMVSCSPPSLVHMRKLCKAYNLFFFFPVTVFLILFLEQTRDRQFVTLQVALKGGGAAYSLVAKQDSKLRLDGRVLPLKKLTNEKKIKNFGEFMGLG